MRDNPKLPSRETVAQWFFDRWSEPVLTGKKAADAMRMTPRTLARRIERGEVQVTDVRKKGDQRASYAFTPEQIIRNLIQQQLAVYGIAPRVLDEQKDYNLDTFMRMFEGEIKKARRWDANIYVSLRDDGTLEKPEFKPFETYLSDRHKGRSTITGSYLTIPIGKFAMQAASIAYHEHNPYSVEGTSDRRAN